MYVVAQHKILNPDAAFPRGEKLIRGEGAPPDVRVLQFYPSEDASAVTCLWEATSVDAIQGYVDETLGDASENDCYEVNAAQAFSERPLGLPAEATAEA